MNLCVVSCAREMTCFSRLQLGDLMEPFWRDTLTQDIWPPPESLVPQLE